MCLLDTLHARSVVASRPSPHSDAADGTSYRITAPATAEWTGKEDNLAVRISGAWHFIVPQEGMLVFDQDAGLQLVFRSAWTRAVTPAGPTGGTVIDTQAREAIAALIQTLQAVGVFGADGS